MANSLKDRLAQLYKTTQTDEAIRGKSGETLTKGQKSEPMEEMGNYLPLLALGVAVALLAWAVLKSPSRSAQYLPRVAPLEEDYPQEESSDYEDSYPPPGAAW